MKPYEFYQEKSFKLTVDIDYVCVIKLLKPIKAGKEAEPEGYTFNEDGWDFVVLLCNSCLASHFKPITNSELKSRWVKISRTEVDRLEKIEMQREPSTWNHKLYLEQANMKIEEGKK